MSSAICMDSMVCLRNQSLIGGKWLGSPRDRVTNPATGELVGLVPDVGAEGAKWAVEAADAAFGQWSKATAQVRSDILYNWHRAILRNRERLARLLTMEQGKPLSEAESELDYAASFVKFFAEEARRIYGETIPSRMASERILVLRQPVGVVVAITPWNFPAAMVTRKVAPALAVGCTVVLKPAPETPLTAIALADLALEAGLPNGVLNVVTGDAPSIGKVFTEHSAVRTISFTGSTAVGRHLMESSAPTIKRVALELGGNAPLIVFHDADLTTAVDGAIASKFRNMGQTCICTNRIYVHRAIKDEFVRTLVRKVSTLKVGNGLHLGVEQGPLINEAAVRKVERHLEDAKGKGARVLHGGKRHELGRTFFEPTVMDDVKDTMLITQEETFGPVAAVSTFDEEAEVLRLANNADTGLASYFFTRDLSRAFRVAESLQCGMVGINSVGLSNESAPFGGVKQSGLGREGSHHGTEEFMDMKYVLVGGLQ